MVKKISGTDQSYYRKCKEKQGSALKNPPANAGDSGLVPGFGRSPGEQNGNPLQYSCLENPMEGGAWWATVHGIAKSRTRLSDKLLLRKRWGVGWRFRWINYWPSDGIIEAEWQCCEEAPYTLLFSFKCDWKFPILEMLGFLFIYFWLCWVLIAARGLSLV